MLRRITNFGNGALATGFYSVNDGLPNSRNEAPSHTRRGREKLAYEAQERWLKLFGRDRARDFEIDPFTRLLITSCYF